MTQSTERQLIHPRIDADTHKALVAFAHRTHRSVNQAVNHILSEFLVSEVVETATAVAR